jgi:hypothetical protein
LKEKREAKHPKTNNSIAHQQYVNGSSCIDMTNEDNNSETSSSDEDTGEEYVTSQVNNNESSNSGEIWKAYIQMSTLQSVAMV